ncbi:2,3,4,5-tetrahydropyridine-2,6-dicarboxylate N-acetyltransferase [Candidatus Anstonella stagnisolia]|nr:2,3,4,5-tetrahydropyridine-2,6-dicarboxylate N-acetyltransferase [Candidatus Anstonella stagnisolia]
MDNIFFDMKEIGAIGKGAIVGRTVRMRRPALVSIGRNSIIDDFAYISCQLKMGDFSHVGAGCHMIGGPAAKVSIGNFVNIAPSANIVAGQNDYRGGGLVGPTIPEGYGDHSDVREIGIGNHVLFGCNVVVLPGVKLPEGVSVGAFSLLKSNIEYKPWTLYAGIPAKEIGKRDGSLMKEQEEKLMKAVREGLL